MTTMAGNPVGTTITNMGNIYLMGNRQSHDNNKSLNDQINKYKEEINFLIEIKDNLERRNE